MYIFIQQIFVDHLLCVKGARYGLHLRQTVRCWQSRAGSMVEAKYGLCSLSRQRPAGLLVTRSPKFQSLLRLLFPQLSCKLEELISTLQHPVQQLIYKVSYQLQAPCPQVALYFLHYYSDIAPALPPVEETAILSGNQDVVW